MRIFLADSFNFRKQNFPFLYTVIKEYKLGIVVDLLDKDFKYNYRNINFEGFYDNHSIQELNLDSYNKILSGEFFFHLATKDHLSEILPLIKPEFSEDLSILDSSLYDSLKLKTEFFLEYWLEQLKKEKIDLIIFFGGNLIYNKTLFFIAKFLQIPTVVLESFYTGKDYYFELGKASIPNNVSVPKDISILEKNVIQNYRLYNSNYYPKNKNVRQSIEYLTFDKVGRPYILILGQVRNDFSILDSKNTYLNSVKFYINLINKLINETDFCVVFKAHPYEVKKLEEGSFLTIDLLRDKFKDRVYFINDFPIDALIDGAAFSITLNSQSAIQCAQRNKLTIEMGNAFYRDRGFTYSATLDNIIDVIKSQNMNFTIDNFTSYYDFICCYKLNLVNDYYKQLQKFQLLDPCFFKKKDRMFSKLYKCFFKNII